MSHALRRLKIKRVSIVDEPASATEGGEVGAFVSAFKRAFDVDPELLKRSKDELRARLDARRAERKANTMSYETDVLQRGQEQATAWAKEGALPFASPTEALSAWIERTPGGRNWYSLYLAASRTAEPALEGGPVVVTPVKVDAGPTSTLLAKAEELFPEQLVKVRLMEPDLRGPAAVQKARGEAMAIASSAEPALYEQHRQASYSN